MAPRMTAMACSRFRMRLWVRPVVMTETAVLLWVSALAARPVRAARAGFADSEWKISLRRWPAKRARPDCKSRRPRRSKPRPASR